MSFLLRLLLYYAYTMAYHKAHYIIPRLCGSIVIHQHKGRLIHVYLVYQAVYLAQLHGGSVHNILVLLYLNGNGRGQPSSIP